MTGTARISPDRKTVRLTGDWIDLVEEADTRFRLDDLDYCNTGLDTDRAFWRTARVVDYPVIEVEAAISWFARHIDPWPWPPRDARSDQARRIVWALLPTA